jgi:hypothetical protein
MNMSFWEWADVWLENNLVDLHFRSDKVLGKDKAHCILWNDTKQREEYIAFKLGGMTTDDIRVFGEYARGLFELPLMRCHPVLECTLVAQYGAGYQTYSMTLQHEPLDWNTCGDDGEIEVDNYLKDC